MYEIMIIKVKLINHCGKFVYIVPQESADVLALDAGAAESFCPLDQTRLGQPLLSAPKYGQLILIIE